MSLSHSDGWHDLVVMTPQRFEDGLNALLAVRDQRTVLLNLSRMDSEQAQRTADFVSGGVHALDGHQQRVGESVLLFAPASIRLDWLSSPDQRGDHDPGHP
jgi:cell division inhibitor SepF